MSAYLDYTIAVGLPNVIILMAPLSASALMAILEMDIIAVGLIICVGTP